MTAPTTQNGQSHTNIDSPSLPAVVRPFMLRFQLALALFFVVAALGCGQRRVVIESYPESDAARLEAATADAGQTLVRDVEAFAVSGIDVILKPTPGKPTVSLGLYLRGGSAQAKPEDVGLETLMMQLVAEGGSETQPRDVMLSRLGLLGGAIGGDAAALTCTFGLEALRKNWDDSFALFADVVMHPAWPADELERMRTRQLEFLESLPENPDTYVTLLSEDLLLGEHPYRQRAWGTPENIGRFGVEELRAHYAEVLVKSRMLFVVVGDVTRAELEQKLAASFATLPEGSPVALELPPLAEREPGYAGFAKATPTSYVLASFRAPEPSSDEYYAMVVALSLLGDRLFEKVRSDMQLSYAVAAGVDDSPSNSGYLYVSSSSPALAYAQILDEVESMQDWLVSERELEQQIAMFATGFFMGLETQAAQRQLLARFELLRGGWEKAGDLLSQLRAVDAKAVRAVMRRWVRGLQVGFYGDEAAFPEVLRHAEPALADRLLLSVVPAPSPEPPPAEPPPAEPATVTP